MSIYFLKFNKQETNTIIEYLTGLNKNIDWSAFIYNIVLKKNLTFKQFIDRIKKNCWIDSSIQTIENDGCKIQLLKLYNTRLEDWYFNPYYLNSCTTSDYVCFATKKICFDGVNRVKISEEVDKYPEILQTHFTKMYETMRDLLKSNLTTNVSDTNIYIIGDLTNDLTNNVKKMIILIWCNVFGFEYVDYNDI